MKVLIVVLALVATVAAEDWVPKTLEEIRALRAECFAENPVPTEYLEKLKLFEYTDVEPVRKFVQCSVQKIGVFCDHMGYHAERVAKQFKLQLDETEALAIAEKCVDHNTDKSTTDVWAFRGFLCFLNSKLGDGIKEFVKKQAVKA